MKKNILALLTISMIFLAGCAEEGSKEKQNSVPPEAPVVVVPNDGSPYVPDGDGPGQGPGDNYEFGGTADFTPVSTQVFSEYAGRPINKPTDMKVNVNLVRTEGTDTFGGHITISYTDNGVFRQGYFTSGSSAQETQYNEFIPGTSNTQFRAVFEDYLGAIVLIIDDYEDLGDGSDEVIASGSIYFENFGITYAPHPPTRCWFVSIGPYDCRPWPWRTGMQKNPPLLPTVDDYAKLGTFTGLKIDEAFNGEI